jgi:PAS domain-containing protein
VSQVESVAFRIVPPFYRRPLFLALGALWLALSLAWAGVFWRRERRARTTIAEREAYFRSLIENASDLISVVDQTGQIQYQSPSSLAILGYSPEERVGRSMFELLHPRGRASDGRGRAGGVPEPW